MTLEETTIPALVSPGEKYRTPIIELEAPALDRRLMWTPVTPHHTRMIRGGENKEVMNLMGEIVNERSPGWFMDVGANIGFFSLWASLKHGMSVLGFEPHPGMRELARCHLRRYAETPFKVWGYALSDQDGITRFKPSLHCSQIQDEGTIEVETMRLDSLITENDKTPPTLIKIDVEGHERQVIAGAVKTLRQWEWLPLIIETHQGVDVNRLLADLKVIGYEHFRTNSKPLEGEVKGWPQIVALRNV